MKQGKGTYCKALVLILVFSLNILVGFACSFSSAFHSLHHHELPAAAHVHGTENGRHQHHQKTEPVHGHHHHQSEPASHDNDAQPPVQQEDCCSGSVVEVVKADKTLSRTIEAPGVHVLTAFVASYFSFTPLVVKDNNSLREDHGRRRPPGTIQDLRIVIQSFQI